MRPLFCPRCHREVEIPQMVKDGKVKLGEGSTLNLGCNHCGKGSVTVDAEALT